MKFAAVVLAAGHGRRMGGPNKLLLPVAGLPLVAHAVRGAIAAGAGPVVVVTGHAADAVEAGLARSGVPTVQIVRNPDSAAGMGMSLAVGAGAVPDTVDALLVWPGDLAPVPGEDVHRVIAAFEGGMTIVVPVHDGRRGHPVLLAAGHLPALRALGGDEGGRSILARHASAVREVPASRAVLFDVDTPEDYRRLLAESR